MEPFGNPWALVLAAGEGTRLRSLTTDPEGRSIPKQFCTLNGEHTLLRLALRRAHRIASPERVTTIVAEQHDRWWRSDLGSLPERNVIPQPMNRGTAVGILLPLLSILQRDPGARIVVLPSDHFFADEAAVARAMGLAVASVVGDPRAVVLLGVVPDGPDSELGWIVPGAEDGGGARRVERFVEKPPPKVASELMRCGGVWNSFIFSADGGTLLELFEQRMPSVVGCLRAALPEASSGAGRAEALAEVYATLSTYDFSRDILEGHEDRLKVLPVPGCRWSDLGTPERVARCVSQMEPVGVGWTPAIVGAAVRPNLGRVRFS